MGNEEDKIVLRTKQIKTYVSKHGIAVIGIIITILNLLFVILFDRYHIKEGVLLYSGILLLWVSSVLLVEIDRKVMTKYKFLEINDEYVSVPNIYKMYIRVKFEDVTKLKYHPDSSSIHVWYIKKRKRKDVKRVVSVANIYETSIFEIADLLLRKVPKGTEIVNYGKLKDDAKINETFYQTRS